MWTTPLTHCLPKTEILLWQLTVSDRKSFPYFKQYLAARFSLPASRKVTATERDHHHRGRQETVRGTSHVELLSLQKSRLFIPWVALCCLVVPTSNSPCKGQLLKAAKTDNVTYNAAFLSSLLSVPSYNISVNILHNTLILCTLSFLLKHLKYKKFAMFPKIKIKFLLLNSDHVL